MGKSIRSIKVKNCDGCFSRRGLVIANPIKIYRKREVSSLR